MSRDEDIGASIAMAIGIASASMSMLARRKKREAQPETETKPEPVTTNTISPEEQAEMDRAPRAYRRRLMKSLAKAKGGAQQVTPQEAT